MIRYDPTLVDLTSKFLFFEQTRKFIYIIIHSWGSQTVKLNYPNFKVANRVFSKMLPLRNMYANFDASFQK